MKFRNLLALCLAFVMVIALAGCSSKESAEVAADSDQAITTSVETPVFKIGAIPDQNTSKLNKRFDELAAYLGEKTGLQVEYVPSVDYSALVTGFERGEVQLAWFGGLTGVQARNAVPNAQAIAQRPLDEKFQSVIIAQNDLDVSTLEDLKGLSFTFGSESSTSGHLMPRFYIMEAGIDPEVDFNGKPNFSGSHDTTWKLVEAGTYQAGALNIAVWESAVKDGLVDLDKVKLVYTTPEYYDYNWTINDVDSVYGEGTTEKIKAALLSFGEDKPEIMELFSDEKFIETNNDNYSAIETVAKSLGIIK